MLKVPVKYYYSEIDPAPTRVLLSHFPDSVALGDVCQVTSKTLPDNVELLIGGSPCQGLSNQTGSGLKDPRSKLFFEYVRIWKLCKPNYFFFENVAKMKKADHDFICRIFRRAPIRINSVHHTGATRHRLYWTNAPLSFVKLPARQPKLKDVAQPLKDVDERFRVTEARILRLMKLKAGVDKGAFGNTAVISRLDTHVNALTASMGDDNARVPKFVQDGVLRRITPIESERLQGLPDDYTAGESDSQRYKMIGNGFTVTVVAAILKSAFCKPTASENHGNTSKYRKLCEYL
jgi:site-specific DNA-cytosine methylase